MTKRMQFCLCLIGLTAVSLQAVPVLAQHHTVFEVNLWEVGSPDHLSLFGGANYFELEVQHDHNQAPEAFATTHLWYGTASNSGPVATNGFTFWNDDYYYDGSYIYALCSIGEVFQGSVFISDVWVSTGASSYDEQAYVWPSDSDPYTVNLFFAEHPN